MWAAESFSIECTEPNSLSRPALSTRKITIYIESDFAAELKAQTPSSNDANLTETQLRTAILQLAEIWNLQTRAVALVYGGTGDFVVPNDFCTNVAASTTEKAIYINFKPDRSPADQSMTYRKASGANCNGNNHAEIVVWGTNKHDNPINWVLGSQGSDFSNSMLHELGHTVGLGHSDDVNECRAVMAGCHNITGGPFRLWGGRFPLPWDKECSRASAKRELTSRYIGFNSSGTLSSSGVLLTYHEQASLSSGFVRSAGNSPYASIYHVEFDVWNPSHAYYSYLGSDGNFPFNPGPLFQPAPSDIRKLYTAPIVHF